MGKIDSWITKLPRLKNSKVARFSYKAEAYANDDIEGVENYDYSRDMNIPSATHTDFDPDVLSIGARSNFSSIPKNGLNHFFGRVSYNLNKVIDFLSDFLDDFIALNNSFISFTEIVSFSSSATLSNYANGSTKRLLSTAGSNITITLPVGETYLGNSTITLTPSIMLTIAKRGTVWVNSSGTAITALTADKWKTARNVTISDADGTNTGTAVSVDGSENETLKLPSTIKATLAGKSKDSYPIPTDAVLQYSFDEIKQLPDNPTGTVYKRDNDWATVDGWYASHVPSTTLSIETQSLKVVYDGTRPDTGISFVKDSITYNGKFIVGRIKATVPITSVSYYTGTGVIDLKITKTNSYDTVFYGYMSSAYTPSLVLYVNRNQLTAKTCWIDSLYIGDGSYLEPVIDNSYSESHAENHGVIPVDGVCGKAGYFNNSYMIAPRPALGDDITIYFWAKFDALGTQTIVQSRTVTDLGLSVFRLYSAYRLDWRGSSSYFTGYTPPVNAWHHVCMKMNATTKVLKINGELKSTLTGTYGTTTNLASTIWAGFSGEGGTPSGAPLTGALDGLKIVPRYTTDDEDIGEYKARANHPKFYATADKWKTARNVTISDADGTNTGTAVSVDGSEDETLKLPPTIKATLSGNASTATEIKPLGNSITLQATPTSVTKIIKVATVDWAYAGTINIRCNGAGIIDEVKIYFSCTQSSATGAMVLYNKINTSYGIKRIVVTRDSSDWDSNRQIYAEIVTYANNPSTTSIGIVETNVGSLTPSMTAVSSIEGTVVDSLPLDYLRGDISSYQHVFTKNIIGNVTGSATTATTANVRVSLRHGTTWFSKIWTGLTDFYVDLVWTDGENIYYSNETTHYVLNKATSTWSTKTWTGLTDFNGDRVWTDGEQIYHSYATTHYVLNKATSTWSTKTWTGLTDFYGERVWTDGDNIYYSYATTHYVLNKATSTWSTKTWTGLNNFNGNNIWTDGENIYYSNDTAQYVLNKATSTWVSKTWSGFVKPNGNNIWTDGENIYYSNDTAQYVLNKATSTWVSKTWSGFVKPNGSAVWTDGENIYHSISSQHYVIPATRHNYVDDTKYNSLFGTVTNCICRTLSDRFVFGNE